MTGLSIKNATASVKDPAIATLVLAFSSDPAARWLYRDPRQYLDYFPHFIQAFAGKAFEYHSAYYIDDFAGTALWLPPGVHPDDQALMALLQHTISGRDQGDVFRVLEQMNRYHPPEPHWYLPMIGVDPSYQGKGFGSALLGHVLRQCDREGKLAYLESSNSKNIPFYQRHGFRLLATIQEGASSPIFPMVRQVVEVTKGAALTRPV